MFVIELFYPGSVCELLHEFTWGSICMFENMFH